MKAGDLGPHGRGDRARRGGSMSRPGGGGPGLADGGSPGEGRGPEGTAEAGADGGGDAGADAGPAAEAGSVSSSGAFTRRASPAAAFTAAGSPVLTTTTGAEVNSCRATPAASASAVEPVSTTVAADGACVWATKGRCGVPSCGCAEEPAVVGRAPEQAVTANATTDNTARNVPPRCLSICLST
jgi:hypothetical protein